MGTVKRKTFTMPVPNGAELVKRDGKQIAIWRGRDGRKRTGTVNAAGRVVVKSDTYVATFRDSDGVMRTVSTGCHDKGGALRALQNLEDMQERMRLGIVSPVELDAAAQADKPVHVHVQAFLDHLAARECTAKHIAERKRYLSRLVDATGWKRLRDLDRVGLERFLTTLAHEGTSARVRNCYRTSAVAFATWCVRDRRLTVNPFDGVASANEAADRRRERRALTNDELAALLDAAERRPLHDAMHNNRGDEPAKLSDDTVLKLERRGRERRLIYLVMASTGLRRGEVAGMRVSDLDLTADNPTVRVRAAISKNRRDAVLPLHSDLASELRAWVADRLAEMRLESIGNNHPVPLTLPGDMTVFDVPDKMTRVFDRDLAFAGIAKKDAAGRTLDVHSLRTTFGTRLARQGVPLQVAQRLMRHSDPALTSNVYTVLDGGDLAGAVAGLGTPKLTSSTEQNEGTVFDDTQR